MVVSSDARDAALEQMVEAVLAGGSVDTHESQLLDCKEDSSLRAADGSQGVGEPRSEPVAKMIADAIACFANADGGIVMLGVDDKQVGSAAFVGTVADLPWIKNRIRQLLELEVDVRARKVAGAACAVIMVDPSAVPIADTSKRYRKRQGRDCQTLSNAELGSFSVGRHSADWSAAMTAHTVAEADPAAVAQLRAWLEQSPDPSRTHLAGLDDTSLLHELSLSDVDGRLNRAGELMCVRLRGRGPLIA